MAEDGLEPEEGYFHPDFKVYAKRELKWSRLDTSGKPDDDYEDECPYKDKYYVWQGFRWVFWSRQDYDYPERPLYHDNFVGSISDACPSPEVIREDIIHGLRKMILDPCLEYTLVQFWAPTKTLEGRTLLTTQHQPFALGKTRDQDDRQRLCEYRMEMCREYNNCFYADAESEEEQLGVPGRVFLHKFSESNSNVKHCSPKEYLQRDLALRCRIRGYWALPVFEWSSQTCIGVLEILILHRSLALHGYTEHFLRHVSDRFQEFGLQCIYGCKDCEMREFGLQCSYGCEDREMRDEDEDENEDKNKALAVAFKELETVLKSVCKIHKLPLAMTWVPCSTCDHSFQGQHRLSSEGSLWCNENIETCHLRKEQVAGRIPTFPKLSYCSDVKQLNIAEHPLVADVRRWKLSGCFTMCLQSSWTGSELYVLEFFLPPISEDDENIQTRLSSILRTVEENSQTFKLACSQEFGGGLAVDVIDFPNGKRSHSIQMIEDTRVFPTLVPLEDGGGMLQLDQPDQPSMDVVNSQMNGVSEARNYNLPSVEPLQNGKMATQLDSSDQSSMDPANNGQDVLTAKRNILQVTSSEESKRKTQKIERSKIGVRIEVSLEDILKWKKMSRHAAAKKLEVSISTLKRVCRDYGINRWPPRNMKKVHSSRPLPSENQEQTPGLSSDLPSNQVSASVVRTKPACQDEDLVTIRAKYENHTIKFRLSLLSKLVELHREVAKRLNLEAGCYHVKYKDEEDVILIACDDDFQDCARYFRSVAKTSIVIQLEPKQTSQLGHSVACVLCSNRDDPKELRRKSTGLFPLTWVFRTSLAAICHMGREKLQDFNL